jgi:uncharacterized protein (TIGR01319 family)
MEAALMIDIGSTFTKACSIDLLEEKILATVCTPSTTNTNVAEGIDKAIQLLNTAVQRKIDYKIRLASSSAAGGLRIVVVGLVPELTVKAGKLSAYNAGAKIVGTYSYKLNKYEIIEIENLNPDTLLFVGGTDGGNEETLLWNANKIAKLEINSPIIFGGNKVIAAEVKEILEKNGKNAFLSENVLSQISKISTVAVKEIIRKIFIEKIIISKGIAKARRYVDKDIIPTPLAVFNAVKLLSSGTYNVTGIGELMAIDIGGATTDVYSSASGNPTLEGTTLKGLALPYAMRTVEGDLGLRINATTTIKEANINNVEKSRRIENIDLTPIIEKFTNTITLTPKTDIEKIVDLEMASYAIQIALKRHVGYLEKQYTPIGEINIQYGKDLTNIKTVLCTGGLFSHTSDRELVEMLNRSISHKYEPFCLKPKCPNYFIDNEYILYAMGLLSIKYPDKALGILKRKLKQIH